MVREWFIKSLENQLEIQDKNILRQDKQIEAFKIVLQEYNNG